MNESKKLKKNGQKFWNQNPCGGEWLSFRKKLNWAVKTEPYILKYINNKILKNKKVLDVGCGQGFLVSLVAPKCQEITGMDSSSNSLQKAKKGIDEFNLNNVKLIQGDAENLPFENNSFDVVYCIGVLHHTPDTQKGIDEIYRVLKPNGKTIIMFYRKFTPKWFAVIILRIFSKILNIIGRETNFIANKIRKKYDKETRQGTALLELFGCPILKMYSGRQMKKLFNKFNTTRIKYHQPGFERLCDFLPKFVQKIIRPIFKWIDKFTKNIFGFYMVIEANK